MSVSKRINSSTLFLLTRRLTYNNCLRQFCGNWFTNSNPVFKSAICFSFQYSNTQKSWGTTTTSVTVLNKENLGYNLRQFAKMSDSEDKKAELKEKLTPLQYHITQEKGTERAFTGKYNKCYETGMYSCVVCDQPLFASQTKFDSGCGWPAFNDVLDQGKVKLTKDTSHGMVRTEVTCSQCNAHLGHVFGDGPAPTRKRFCINSASLQFHPADGSQDSSST